MVDEDDEREQRERAERLRAEIDARRAGDEPPPRSPHEFVERRGRERRTPDADDAPPRGPDGDDA